MSDKWQLTRQRALEKACYKCEKCGTDSQRLHVHHIEPRSEGGTDDITNLEVRCPDCHADAHDAEACVLCGGIIHTGGEATVLDTSGGTLIHVCDDCREIIEAAGEDGGRCGICGRIRNPSRSEGIYWMDSFTDTSMPSVYNICDECRKVIISRPRHIVERYIDEELPDEWVDFKHWDDNAPSAEDEA